MSEVRRQRAVRRPGERRSPWPPTHSRPDRTSRSASTAELNEILKVYGRKVADGEWRDYAIDQLREQAVFSIFRRTSEVPLYRIVKQPRLARTPGRLFAGRRDRPDPQARPRPRQRAARPRPPAAAGRRLIRRASGPAGGVRARAERRAASGRCRASGRACSRRSAACPTMREARRPVQADRGGMPRVADDGDHLAEARGPRSRRSARGAARRRCPCRAPPARDRSNPRPCGGSRAAAGRGRHRRSRGRARRSLGDEIGIAAVDEAPPSAAPSRPRPAARSRSSPCRWRPRRA